MLTTINEKSSSQVNMEDVEEIPVNIKSEEENQINAAWSQVNRYENMSLREKDDAAQGFLPEFQIKGQLPPKLSTPVPRTNPNFKSRRGTTPSNNTLAMTNNNNPRQQYNNRHNNNNQYGQQQKTKYPDPSCAVPYLTFVAPTLEEKAQEESAEEESLGEAGNLLWLYWMNDKVKKRGNGEEGDLSNGTELVYKNQQWKRVKKEFLGRTAQPGEKGEMV
jgi:hypothetical protein